MTARWRWPRWFLLATALTTAASTVVVALSSIAAANGASHGATTTSYEPGAAVGVGTALVVAAFALLGLSLSSARPEPRAFALPPPASNSAR